jgi:plasmid stability protein
MSVRMNISLDDDLADRLRTASDGRPSEYIARAVRARMVEDELRALPDATEADWHAEAEQSAESLFEAR